MVVMLEVPEWSGDHHVAKVGMGSERFNQAGVSPADAKMTSAKRQRLSLADYYLLRAGNWFGLCGTRRCDVQIDTER